jgi:hypothetical protein
MIFLENLFNNCILFIFSFIYKWCKIETMEDIYHKDKKNNNKLMNKVKFEFNDKNEYESVKDNVLNIIQNNNFILKYNISTKSILENTNNKLGVSFMKNCIYIYFNHYYISGSSMFILLNKIVKSTPPKFLKTNPFLGIINLPFYIFDIFNIISLQKKEYMKNQKEKVHLIIEKNIYTKNKRYYLYLSVLRRIYESLQMNRPMIAGLSVAFDELSYINNNVGLIIIKYEITDTIEILEKKIKDASYQAYVSNFILNCPLPKKGTFELRNYLDCIISSMYIKSDLDFKFGWNCSKPPLEQLYAGSVSILRSNNTMDINMVFTTLSSNYSENYLDDFFEINNKN